MSESPRIAPQRWSEVKRLFELALEQPAASREAWLQAQSMDEEVSREVLSLLAHATQAEAPLSVDLPVISRVGTRIGAWLLVRALGSGGMGDVYEVHRADGVYSGRAALKVLKRGMDSAGVLARFEHERRVLARLSHPHIAPLFDAGATPDGLPYFVMAYVDGQPIDLATAKAPLNARLQAFLQLCDAVAYAHRNLLVHRDLKPGNVLVDEHGDVMLLDFGIAKALDTQSDGRTDETQVGQARPYTPRYASPEQIRGEPISTATDIYSLGVLLYQLLTGQSPYGQAKTPADIARAVLETPPTRPSAATTASDAATAPIELRHRERLAGDLDAIVLKALEKLPACRYSSVEAMADDVRCFLDGRPVAAQPPTWAYRTKKFLHRHRVAAVAAAAVTVSLCLGLGGALWQAHEARLARATAEARLAQVRDLMRGFVFRYADAVAHLPGGLKLQHDALSVARQTLEQLLEQTGDDPGVLSDLIEVRGRLADIEGNVDAVSLARPADALAHARATQALAERLGEQRLVPGRAAARVVGAYRVEAQTLRDRGELAASRDRLTQGIALGQRVLAKEASPTQRAWLQAELGAALVALAQVLDRLGAGHDADQPLTEAEQIYGDLLAQPTVLAELDAAGRLEEPPADLYVRNQLATIASARALALSRGTALPRALTEAQRAFDLRRTLVERDPQGVFWRDQWMVDANLLAVLHTRSQQWQAALEAAQVAWDAAARLAAQHERPNKWTMAQPILALQYARALSETGHHAQALQVYADAHAAWERIVATGATPQQQRRAALLEAGYAKALGRVGKVAEARRFSASAVRRLRVLAQTGQFDDLVALAQACAIAARIDSTQAVSLRQEALAVLTQAAAQQALAADHRRLQASLLGTRPPT